MNFFFAQARIFDQIEEGYLDFSHELGCVFDVGIWAPHVGML